MTQQPHKETKQKEKERISKKRRLHGSPSGKRSGKLLSRLMVSPMCVIVAKCSLFKSHLLPDQADVSFPKETPKKTRKQNTQNRKKRKNASNKNNVLA